MPGAPIGNVDRTMSDVTQDIKDRVFAHACLDWERSMRPKEKLRLYLEANEDMEFKPYLKGHLDMGTKLMFRFRSGNIALNGMMALNNNAQDPQCPCCGAATEDVIHALAECPLYLTHKMLFVSQVQSVVGESSPSLAHASHKDFALKVLSPSCWEECHRASICHLAKEFMCRVWQSRVQQVQGGSSLTVPAATLALNGSASQGGAEVYGQLATAPN